MKTKKRVPVYTRLLSNQSSARALWEALCCKHTRCTDKHCLLCKNTFVKLQSLSSVHKSSRSDLVVLARRPHFCSARWTEAARPSRNRLRVRSCDVPRRRKQWKLRTTSCPQQIVLSDQGGGLCYPSPRLGWCNQGSSIVEVYSGGITARFRPDWGDNRSGNPEKRTKISRLTIKGARGRGAERVLLGGGGEGNMDPWMNKPVSCLCLYHRTPLIFCILAEGLDFKAPKSSVRQIADVRRRNSFNRSQKKTVCSTSLSACWTSCIFDCLLLMLPEHLTVGNLKHFVCFCKEKLVSGLRFFPTIITRSNLLRFSVKITLALTNHAKTMRNTTRLKL